MTIVEALGAAGFGAVIGWFVYYINRYRTGGIQLADVVTLVGALGGAAVLAIFPAGSILFGAYGVGLAIGFFGYFIALIVLVARSKGDFTADWFLDGRRKRPQEPFYIPGDGTHPMEKRQDASPPDPPGTSRSARGGSVDG